MVGLIFALFASSSGSFPFASLQSPVASANSPSPSLTLVGKHIKVTGGGVPITRKAVSTFKATVKLVSPASPGATKSILYSNAVTVKLAAHAKKTVKLTLDSAGTKYLAAAEGWCALRCRRGLPVELKHKRSAALSAISPGSLVRSPNGRR